MRPICLRIGGLNSFREVQEIDFTKLCETGVFGIFGATGSGKSTILDAITLALYGTVERASNNTQGILNHAEEQLSVEYHFSLATGSQRITYRAERAYRRSGDRTVKASTCRLVEIVEGVETVLASKGDEMTKKMEDILGLTVEDFTRAVVLPQGKFAEFLTIKPRDRRQMLERLFSLEAYGRELSARLNEQLGSAEFDLNGVEQRQQGLGDASAERVREAELDCQAAIVVVKEITKELKSLQLKYDDAKEIWGLQEQLQHLQEKEVQLTTTRSDMDSMAECLILAERAEAIRPILDEISLSEERFKQALGQFESANNSLKASRLAKEIAEGKWSEANLKRLESEPQCLRQLERLEQAKGLEDDIQTRDRRLTETRYKYGELDRTRKELEHTIQAALDSKAKALKQQTEVKNQLTQITVDPAQRTRVNDSAQALEAYEIISQQVDDLQRDREKNASEIAERQSRLRISEAEVQAALESVEHLKEVLISRQQNPPVHEESLSTRAQELERCRHLIANLERAEREALEEQERLPVLLKDRQKSLVEVETREKEQGEISLVIQETLVLVERITLKVKELEQQNLAGLIVDTLVEGEPCPVCGSAHHPKLAQSLDDTILFKARAELDQASRELQKLESKRNEGATALAVAKAQLSSKQALAQSQLDLVETKKRALVNYRRELSEADGNKETQVLNAQRIEEESNLTRDRLSMNLWKTAQEQLNRELLDAQKSFTEVDKNQQAMKAQIASTEGVGMEILNRLNLLLVEQAQRKTRLDSLRGSIAVPEISWLQKQYASWDQTTRTLNLELAGLEEGLRESDETQQRLLREKTNCEIELQNLKTVGSEAARDIEELRSKCNALTGGRPTLELILQVRQELAAVTETEEKLKTAYELAQGVCNQAEQVQVVSHKTLEFAREGFDDAQLKLAQGLKAAQFMTTSEALSALANEADRIKMDQTVSAFRQEVLSLKQKRQDLEERLKGRSLRPEEWLAWPLQLKDVENTHNEALERRGAAQQRLEKLSVEHEEWMRLERERKILSHRRSLLKTLQSVFKGNAFIEFIAQEQLTNVALDASERLKQLTNQRYALEVDAEGGFVMRDDANGGARRPVSSLSGGETFLTALALALALSTQIQLRGESPLEFFFLDEGFGTLDADLLETVMNTLEKLHLQNLTLGIISHVPELKNRLARRLLVTAAEAGGAGSRVKLEMA